MPILISTCCFFRSSPLLITLFSRWLREPKENMKLRSKSPSSGPADDERALDGMSAEDGGDVQIQSSDFEIDEGEDISDVNVHRRDEGEFYDGFYNGDDEDDVQSATHAIHSILHGGSLARGKSKREASASQSPSKYSQLKFDKKYENRMELDDEEFGL